MDEATANGTGILVIDDNDEARITVGVSSTAASAAAASAANNRTMSRLATALEGAGVRVDDIQTRNLTLGRIEYGAQKGQYRAENLVEIRVRDVSKAGAAIDSGWALSSPSLRRCACRPGCPPS